MITVPSNDAGPLTAVVVSCNVGGVLGWPRSIALEPSGDFYGYHDLFTDLDWESERHVRTGTQWRGLPRGRRQHPERLHVGHLPV